MCIYFAAKKDFVLFARFGPIKTTEGGKKGKERKREREVSWECRMLGRSSTIGLRRAIDQVTSKVVVSVLICALLLPRG